MLNAGRYSQYILTGMIANERCRDFAQTNREKRGNFAPGGPSSPEYRKVILRVSFFLNFRTHGTKSPHFLYWYVLNRDTPSPKQL